MNNIILIGFMGSGKTTIARQLSTQLKIKWVDTDKLIESISGKTIPELFKHSEAYFRSWELTIVKSFNSYKNTIISTGGGIIIQKDCRDIIKKSGDVIYLDISADTVLERLKHDTKRPLLQQENRKEVITSLLNERDSLYRDVADLSISVDRLSIHDIIDQIQNYRG